MTSTTSTTLWHWLFFNSTTAEQRNDITELRQTTSYRQSLQKWHGNKTIKTEALYMYTILQRKSLRTYTLDTHQTLRTAAKTITFQNVVFAGLNSSVSLSRHLDPRFVCRDYSSLWIILPNSVNFHPTDGGQHCRGGGAYGLQGSCRFRFLGIQRGGDY